MSKKFYSENEELNLEESLDKYQYLFENIKSEPPTLEEALIDMFQNAGLNKDDAKELYNHLYNVCNHKVQENWNAIKYEHKNISKNDALVISSYTYEPKGKFQKYSPYGLLNQNLVKNDRKSGVTNVENYLFLFLQALRGLNKTQKNVLFRCISKNVKNIKNLKNGKFVPYSIGAIKTFWPFTSTSDDEKTAENFLGKGEGTKFRIQGDDLWGYDISLFNVYNEKEILLEPERKYMIKNVEERNNIAEVTVKIIDNPKLLGNCDFLKKILCPNCGSDNILLGNLMALNLNALAYNKNIKTFVDPQSADFFAAILKKDCKDCGYKF